VKNLTVNTTVTFDNLLGAKKRITHHIGGTRSGKTYAILQYLIVKALQEELNITIVRRTVPSLKRSVIKDFKDIMLELGIWSNDSYNISDRVYTFSNGSLVSFLNTDDAEKLRGVKSNILFIDEASEQHEEAYFQLSIRTSGEIILAYNPTVSPYHFLRNMDDVETFKTTYKDNPYLPPAMVKEIEALQKKNPKYWQIYGLGEYTVNEKAVFQNFQIVDEIPIHDLVGFGLDFGYSQDPTALVAVHRHHDMLYCRELMYDRGLTTQDIITKLKQFNIGRETEIWADSAEPRLIEEIYRSGFNIKPVKKGPDSIRFGLSVLQNFGICVERHSTHLIDELYGYEYVTDKNGYVTDKPQDFNNHLIDALRYLAMSRLSIKQQNKGKYTISFK
jgi:phage terminase large subunit